MSTSSGPIDGLDLTQLDPEEMARAVGEAPDEQLRQAMASDLRAPILAEAFRRFPDFLDPARTRGVDAAVEWLISDDRGGADRYLLSISSGECRAGADVEGEPRVTLELGAVAFLKLVTGNANVPVMFLTGGLRVRGDAAFAAELAGFFRVPGRADGRADVDPGAVDALEMARAIGSASDAQLAEGMRSPLREMVLDEVFRRFPEYLDPARTRGVRAAIKFKIGGRAGGGDDRYVVVIDDGSCRAGRDLDAEPRATIVMDGVEFLNLVSGNSNPTMTFMRGKLRVHGDLLFAAQLVGFFKIPSTKAA